MLLSVVLPTHQQAHRLRHTFDGLRKIHRLLPYPVEVIIADAGSTDGTPELCEEAGYRVLHLDDSGQGAAIRAGMLAASGIYRVLIDSDWSIPPEHLQLLLPPVLTGFDISIASRHMPGAVRVNEPLSSYAFGRAFNRAVQSLVLPDLTDTQFAYKCFRAETARALFSRTRESGSAVHVEVLALARMFGLDIVEVPVDWTFHPALHSSPLLEAPALLAALVRIRGRLTAGRYAPLQMSGSVEVEERSWSL